MKLWLLKFDDGCSLRCLRVGTSIALTITLMISVFIMYGQLRALNCGKNDSKLAAEAYFQSAIYFISTLKLGFIPSICGLYYGVYKKKPEFLLLVVVLLLLFIAWLFIFGLAFLFMLFNRYDLVESMAHQDIRKRGQTEQINTLISPAANYISSVWQGILSISFVTWLSTSVVYSYYLKVKEQKSFPVDCFDSSKV